MRTVDIYRMCRPGNAEEENKISEKVLFIFKTLKINFLKLLIKNRGEQARKNVFAHAGSKPNICSIKKPSINSPLYDPEEAV